MSPLQFQKQLRLQEARRLMLGEDVDATSAGYRVGDHDPAHVNRAYKRLVGDPPMRDVDRLRGAARERASLCGGMQPPCSSADRDGGGPGSN